MVEPSGEVWELLLESLVDGHVSLGGSSTTLLVKNILSQLDSGFLCLYVSVKIILNLSLELTWWVLNPPHKHGPKDWIIIVRLKNISLCQNRLRLHLS